MCFRKACLLVYDGLVDNDGSRGVHSGDYFHCRSFVDVDGWEGGSRRHAGCTIDGLYCDYVKYHTKSCRSQLNALLA